MPKPTGAGHASAAGPWQTVSEKVLVAAVTALATALVTVGLPLVSQSMVRHDDNGGGLSKAEVAFQQRMWLNNSQCLADPTPLWHDSLHDRQVDATVCPGTGDILVVMRNQVGKQIQFWADLSELNRQFEPGGGNLAALGRSLIGRAQAATMPQTALPRTQLAQSVLCQRLFPNGLLRRRIVVAPNQCMEIVINTQSGQVVSQRHIPCVPDCATNV